MYSMMWLWKVLVYSEGKCLGYWWGRDLFASRAVDENIQKARRAFFLFGNIGAFQGDLSPLSAKSIIETCVIPILLYGSENWILTGALTDKLDRFLGEISKRVLRWPKYHSNSAALVVLGMESVKSRVLSRKLGFLKRKIGRDSVGVGGEVVRVLMDDIESLCLVKECRELEECVGVSFVDDLMVESEIVRMKDVKDAVKRAVWERLVNKCKEKAPLVATIGEDKKWMALWDKALDLG